MKTKTEIFISKANVIHNHIYNYSDSDYTNSKVKLTIICKEHGSFQQTPNGHLKGHGCPKCAIQLRAENKKLSLEEFIKRAKKAHGSKYSYDNVVYSKGIEKVLITCKSHGDFKQRPSDHFSGYGCPKCAKNSLFSINSYTLEDFINKANEKHNNKYDYSKVKYNKASDEIVINCPIHGDFEQRAVNHLSGSGCNTCGIELTGHSKTAFKENCNRNNKGFGILYVIRCFNDTESFYKVGITSLSIKIRFKKDMPYNYEVIKQIIDEPIIIFNLENKLLSLTNEYRYEPILSFGGQTECFSNLEVIKQYLI